MGDPQQEIFTELLVQLRAAGYSVYDGALPPEDVPYPFIYLAESQQVDTQNKSGLFGSVYQTVNVWHDNPEQRGTVSGILFDIKTIGRKIEHTTSYAWHISTMEQTIQADTTTKQPLLRGILDLEFKFG